MSDNTSPTRAYTHRGDMDGLLCEALLRDSFPDLKVYALNYDELDHITPPCIVCDVNLPEEHPVWQSAGSIVLDHHPSSAPAGHACKYHHDQGHCAAYLVWNSLDRPDEWRALLAVVEAGDLWLKDNNRWFRHARELGALFNAVGYERMLELVLDSPAAILQRPILTIAGALRTQIGDTQSQVARATLTEAEDFVACFVHDGSASEVANTLASEHEKPCAAIPLSLLQEGKPLGVSVRDCAGRAQAFAEARGGGGHPDAAGFRVSAEHARAVMVGALRLLLNEEKADDGEAGSS